MNVGDRKSLGNWTALPNFYNEVYRLRLGKVDGFCEEDELNLMR